MSANPKKLLGDLEKNFFVYTKGSGSMGSRTLVKMFRDAKLLSKGIDSHFAVGRAVGRNHGEIRKFRVPDLDIAFVRASKRQREFGLNQKRIGFEGFKDLIVRLSEISAKATLEGIVERLGSAQVSWHLGSQPLANMRSLKEAIRKSGESGNRDLGWKRLSCPHIGSDGPHSALTPENPQVMPNRGPERFFSDKSTFTGAHRAHGAK